jgi:hypothetical protein
VCEVTSFVYLLDCVIGSDFSRVYGSSLLFCLAVAIALGGWCCYDPRDGDFEVHEISGHSSYLTRKPHVYW